MDRKQRTPKAEPLRELHNEEAPQRTRNSGRGHATHTDERAPVTPKPDVWIENIDAPRFVDEGVDCSGMTDDQGEWLRMETERDLNIERQSLMHKIALLKNTLELEQTKLGNFESRILVEDLLWRLEQLRKANDELLGANTELRQDNNVLREDNAGLQEDFRVSDEAEGRVLETLNRMLSSGGTPEFGCSAR